MDLVITGGTVYYERNGSGLVSGPRDIRVTGNTICSVATPGYLSQRAGSVNGAHLLILSDDHIVMPGFYGAHCHAGDSKRIIHPALGTCDPVTGEFTFIPDEIIENTGYMMQAHGRYGTTSINMSELAIPLAHLEQLVCRTAHLYGTRLSPDGATFRGIDFESNFFVEENIYREKNPNLGAQNPRHFVPPELFLREYKRLEQLSMSNRGSSIKRVCIGFDADGKDGRYWGRELSDYVMSQGRAAVGIGHTIASLEQVIPAIAAEGRYVIVHWGNGQTVVNTKADQLRAYEGISELMQRADKVSATMMAEIICDLKHLDKREILLAYLLFGADSLLLVDDNIAVIGNSPVARFNLAGVMATISADGLVVVKEGTNGRVYCGSNAPMLRCFTNFVNTLMTCDEDGGLIPRHRNPRERFNHLALDEAVKAGIKAGSRNPAIMYKEFNRIGSITEGKEADLVILRVVKKDYPVAFKLEYVVQGGVLNKAA